MTDRNTQQQGTANAKLIQDYRKIAELHTQWNNARRDGNAELQASLKVQAREIASQDHIAAFTEMMFGDDLTDEQVLELSQSAVVG